ncbi:MAG: SHOCT domain-containing protein [Solirubrobacterales bacterium]|nr:SHOCT domain-containing protein [Solirubrobacterales bacterium]
MPIAADYPFLDVFWTMILFFTWILWIWMMVMILSDVFRRRDIGGWSKAAWTVFLIIFPFLGALIYLIAQHDGMAERREQDITAAQRDFDERVRAAAASNGGTAAEIEKAEQLLARGTIDQQEFEALKTKALAAH